MSTNADQCKYLNYICPIWGNAIRLLSKRKIAFEMPETMQIRQNKYTKNLRNFQLLSIGINKKSRWFKPKINKSACFFDFTKKIRIKFGGLTTWIFRKMWQKKYKISCDLQKTAKVCAETQQNRELYEEYS